VIGSCIVGFDHATKVLAPVGWAINSGEPLDAVTEILGAGGVVVSTFPLGGILLGLIFAIPSYVIFLYFFRNLISWRTSRRLSKV
jgi:hypothetical protein